MLRELPMPPKPDPDVRHSCLIIAERDTKEHKRAHIAQTSVRSDFTTYACVRSHKMN